MKKKGFTLVEFVIAVSIYVIVMLVAIGSFVSINNIRILNSNMKETQQKGRVAMEMISRFAKEATSVALSNETAPGSGKFLTLTMTYSGATAVANISGNNLIFCNPNPSCSPIIDSSAGVTKLQGGATSYFQLVGSVPAKMNIVLALKSGYPTTTKFDDTLVLDNATYLEGLK
jgi:prepilin-type N-terminal cleavage/methylation domain-containing protein